MQTTFVLFLGVAVLVIAVVVIAFLITKRSQGSNDQTLQERLSKDDQRERVLCVWRSPSDGKLVIEMGTKTLRSSLSMSRRERERLGEVIAELTKWLGQGEASPTDDGLVGALEADVPVKQIATSSSALPAGSPMSIVAQINEILQEMLVGTEFAGQKISLVEDPRHGVVVWIGTKRYDGVDSVDVPAVRALIQDAASAWERRHAKR
ncbi:MAG: hypothetical protein HPY45_00950 [Anaerolineae bacterium]|nr:hypothetical protein [Anaerolineae bacterium]